MLQLYFAFNMQPIQVHFMSNCRLLKEHVNAAVFQVFNMQVIQSHFIANYRM